MRRRIYRGALLLPLLFMVVTVVTASSPILAQHQPQEGLFGAVIAVTTPSPGLTRITLDTTTKGVQTVEAAENTAVSIPGRETAFAEDISIGDFLAVLTTGDRLEALSILVKPEVPVTYAHITGSKVGAVGDQISIMDGDGNLITADLLFEGNGVDPAQVVTALVRQNLKTGGVSILAAEAAERKIERLNGALEMARDRRATENVQNLGNRMRAGITGHLTTLQEILNRVNPNIGFVFADALETSLQKYTSLTDSFGLDTPTVKLTGVIEDIDRAGGILFVTPREGPQVRLQLTEVTMIRDVFGADALPIMFQVGHSIVALYEPQTSRAHTINVTFPTLEENLISALLPQVEMGELEGTVAEGTDPSAVPPVAVVRVASGRRVTLAVTPETRIVVEVQQSDLGRLAEAVGKTVKVRYDPSALEALDIETFDSGQAFVSGVVKSFIPKFGVRIPRSTEPGNIAVTTPSGETITLDITEDSVIQPEGQRLDRGAIKLGDLVRPTSRYNAETHQVQKLVLKAPQLVGTIRGKATTSRGRDYLTISTDQLNLVTVSVPSSTAVTRRGEQTGFADIQVGERVISGRYNPLALQALELAVLPPKAHRSTGTISSLDQQFFILNMTPTEGGPLKLLVPTKPGIITRDGNPKASFNELEVGDKVLVAFYRPVGPKEVLRIVVSSQ